MSAAGSLFSSRSIRISIALSLLIVVATCAALLLVRQTSRASQNTLERAQSLAEQLLQKLSIPSQIIIEGQTIVENQSPIAQLATAETTVTESYAMRTTWLGSEKNFHVRARFTGKAGYDLTEKFVINLAADGSRASVTLPTARLLAVEQSQLEILEDDSGYWNRLDAAQRQQALEQLQQKARQSLIESGILTQAQSSIESLFTKLLHEQLPAGLKLDFAKSR